jgi:N-acetyl-gamma-glutamylphosphate reductase
MSRGNQRFSQILTVWPSEFSQRPAVQFFFPPLKIRYRKMTIRTIKETPRIIPGNVPLNIRAMTPEMEQELTGVANRGVHVHFTPCYVPIVRGIVDICRCFAAELPSRAQLLDMFREFYQGQPFVKVYDQPRDEEDAWQYKPYPWVSSVAGTNYCYVGMDIDAERGSIVVMSVLDSVGKGGARVGIENLNIMAGFDRTDGLLDRGLHP